jgi:hypothetical protein
MNNARGLTYGIALGAGLMFLFDPRVGKVRRATVRQKSLRAAHEVETAFGIGARDLTNRMHGVTSRIFGKRRPAHVPPDVLVARVRARLGRVCSHSHAVQVVSKDDGCIELKGPVLESELDRILLGIAHVRGVREIDDDLDVHHGADIPALQGPVRDRMRRLSTPATRMTLGVAAAGLAIVSLVKGHPLGLLAGGAVVVAIAHSVAHRGVGRQASGLTKAGAMNAARGLREAYPVGSEWAPS